MTDASLVGVYVQFRDESLQNGGEISRLTSCNQRACKRGSTCEKLSLRVDKDKAVEEYLPPHPPSGMLLYHISN